VPANGESRPVRIAQFWDDYWPHILRDVGGVVVVFVSVALGLDGDRWSWLFAWPGLLLAPAVAVSGFGGYMVWRRDPGIKTLQRKVGRLEDALQQHHRDYYDLLRLELVTLATELEFSHSERISVYKHDGHAFVMLGRYSSNPEYEKRGRGYYPDDQGCIRDAWRNGEAVIDQLPDPASDPERYADLFQIKWNIDRETTEKLRMKSRSYAAFAIEETARARHTAVIVFESTRTNVLARDKLRQAMDAEGGRISRFLERTRSLEPSPSYARSEGF
jgi:hypothetical protein